MWKNIYIDNQKTNYSISDTGEVKNNKTNKILKQQIQNGYCHCTLSIKPKPKRCRVHRLVAQTFLENPENKEFVNHKDGNRQNNNVNNLE